MRSKAVLKCVCIAAVLASMGCASPWVRIPLAVLGAGAQGVERAKERQARREPSTCTSRRQPDGSVETVCR